MTMVRTMATTKTKKTHQDKILTKQGVWLVKTPTLTTPNPFQALIKTSKPKEQQTQLTSQTRKGERKNLYQTAKEKLPFGGNKTPTFLKLFKLMDAPTSNKILNKTPTTDPPG